MTLVRKAVYRHGRSSGKGERNIRAGRYSSSTAKDSRIIELEAEEDTIPYIIKTLAEKEILISRVSARTLSLEEKYMMITDQEDAV